MRVLLDLYADEGHLHGRVLAGEDAIPVPFSGVLELVAVLEELSPEPQPDDQ